MDGKEKVKAVVCNGNQVCLVERDRPVPGKDELLLKVVLCGICNTDLEILKGYNPFTGILGHEFIAKVASDNDFVEGTRVVADINIGCGACEMCGLGNTNHCYNRRTIGINRYNGAMCEYLVVPKGNVVKVPGSIPDEVAVFAEPLAAAMNVEEQILNYPKDGEICVIGDGKLGLLVAFCLLKKEFKVTLVGKHKERSGFFKGLPLFFLQEIPKKKYGVVVEVTGRPLGLELAMKTVAPRGQVILKSTYKDFPVVNPSFWVVNEITLSGSRCGNMNKAIHFLKNEQSFFHKMIDGVYSIDNVQLAFEKAQLRGALKVLLRPNLP